MRRKFTDLDIERNEDTYELEMGDGTVFVFADPKSIHAATLVNFEKIQPADQFRAILGDRADEFFQRAETDGYALEAILADYMSHYGVGTPGEELASSSSSNGTARR